MNRTAILQRLWWKEMRQLIPLMVMLLIGGIATSISIFATRNNFFNSVPWLTYILVVGIPTLFAAGVGALSISHEKETRTLGWIAQLPIASNDLQRVKLQVGFLLLMIVWASSLLLGLGVARFGNFRLDELIQYNRGQPLLSATNWPLQSVFVLLAGLAIAWRRETSWATMLTILPVSLVPWLAAVGFHILSGLFYIAARTDPFAPPNVLITICQLLSIVFAYWLVGRSANKELSAKTTGDNPSPHTLVAYQSWFPSTGSLKRHGTASQLSIPVTPLSALVWQMAKQNRLPLTILGSLLLLGALAATFVTHWALMLAPITYICVCWLGVLTFQGDRLHQRIRFLADRGVSPGQVWLSRHIVALTIFSSVALAYLIAKLFLFNITSIRMGDEFSGLLLTIPILFVGLTVYPVSQWMSQVSLSPIVAVLAAPIFAIAAIGYFLLCITTAGSPPGWLIVGGLIPLLATYHLMDRWMDNRGGVGYWARHALWFTLFLVWPLVPYLYTFTTEPTMPASISAEIDAEIERWASYRTIRKPLSLLPEARDTTAVFDHLNIQLESHDGPFEQLDVTLSYLLGEAALSQLQLVDQTADADNEAIRVRYRASVELLMKIVERLRQDTLVSAQDTADMLEIWLLKVTRTEGADEMFGEPLWDRAIQLLDDHSARKAARLRAVALSWRDLQGEFVETFTVPKFGGYLSPLYLNNTYNMYSAMTPSAHTQLLDYRRTSRRVANLWHAAKGQDNDHSPEFQQRLADDWSVPSSAYGIGVTGHFLRADEIDKFLIPSVSQWGNISPATQWNAGWEKLSHKR